MLIAKTLQCALSPTAFFFPELQNLEVVQKVCFFFKVEDNKNSLWSV